MESKKDSQRNQTALFAENPVVFMQSKTMTTDFAKGLRDNYAIATDPNKTHKVHDHLRSPLAKFFGTDKTRPVSKVDQENSHIRNAVDAITNSGLKTHFFRVMQDADRGPVFNITPDVKAYREKYEEIQSKYLNLPEGPSVRQTRKLSALMNVVSSLMPFSRKPGDESDAVLQAGYFPYKTNLGPDGGGVGKTDLQSKKNATGRMVFTGQMNGCAIAISHTLDSRNDSIEQGTASHFPILNFS